MSAKNALISELREKLTASEKSSILKCTSLREELESQGERLSKLLRVERELEAYKKKVELIPELKSQIKNYLNQNIELEKLVGKDKVDSEELLKLRESLRISQE